MEKNSAPRFVVLKTGPGTWYVKDTTTATLHPFPTKKEATAAAERRNAR